MIKGIKMCLLNQRKDIFEIKKGYLKNSSFIKFVFLQNIWEFEIQIKDAIVMLH